MSPRIQETRVPRRARIDRCVRCASISDDRSTPTTRAPVRATGMVTRPVPQPSSRTGPFARAAMRSPETHVAAIERLRVLPVVEGRVVVPAFPAFS